MAFNFPDPSELQAVTNPITGVNYVWKEDLGKWVVASQTKALGEAITEDLQDLEDRVDAIEADGLDNGLSYMLQTNSITGGSEPAIDLVDSDDGFSNVKIEGVNGINVTSTPSSIVIDGSDVQAIADLDDYYTKTEVDASDQHLQNQVNELLTTKGAASVYTLNDIGIIVGIRPGDFYIDNTVAKNVSFITLAPLDDNGNERPLGAVGDILELVKSDNTTYRYEITTASDGIAGVEFQVAADPDDLLIAGMTFNVYIYPQNKASASIDYVDAGLATKLPKSGGLMSGNIVMGGTANQIMTNKSYIRFGWGDVNTSEEYGGYVYMRDANTFEIGAYTGKTLKFIGEPLFDQSPKVPEPSEDLDAVNLKYVDDVIGIHTSTFDDYLPLLGGELSGTLTTNALVKSTRTSGYAYLVYDEETSTNTAFIHSNGNGRFAQGVFTDNVEIRGSTTLKGDLHLESNLSFTNGGTINVSSGNTALSGRASLDIKTAADYPVVISSGSSYKKVLAIYGYDGSADDNRGEAACIYANGKAYFSEVYANDEELATQTYVDDMGQIYYGNIAPSGSDVHDGDLWVDSGNMRLLMRASGAWVNPDREADTNSFKANATPNGRKFGFSSGTATVTGKLNYYDSGGLKLRLNNQDAFGIKWNDGGIMQDVTMSNGPYFTIWEVVNDTNHKIIRQGRVSRIDYHANDILCHISSHRTNGGFSASKNYWVTIGGII